MNVVIVRSRRKTMSMTVNGAGEIVVRAPLRCGNETISQFVNSHRKWIAARLAEAEKNRFDLSDGAQILLFGKPFIIAEGKCGCFGNTLRLPRENREETLKELVKTLAGREMSVITERIAAQHGFSFRSVKISSARGRWGSCNKQGGISYSFRIAFLPQELIEYVVVHELCHTKLFHHGATFWQEVSKVLPDSSSRRKALKSYNILMNLL